MLSNAAQPRRPTPPPHPTRQPGGTVRRVGQPAWDPSTMTLSVAQSGGKGNDTAPLAIFAAVLAGPVDGFETSLDSFFGGSTELAWYNRDAHRRAG